MFTWMTDPLSIPLPKRQDYCGDNDCRYEDDRIKAINARYEVATGNRIASVFAYGAKWGFVSSGMAEKEAGERADRELFNRIQAVKEFQAARDRYQSETRRASELERVLYDAEQLRAVPSDGVSI